MRTVFALALVVCLSATGYASEWDTTIQDGTKAFHQGAWTEALAAFQAGWPLAETAVERAITANDIGAALHSLARDREARPWFDRAVSLWRSLPNRAEELTQTTLGLVDLYRGIGDFSAAENALGDLIRCEAPPEQKAALYTTLGDVQREQGRNDEARGSFEAAQRLEGLSPKRRIEIWLGLADLDRSIGHFTASVEKWNSALALARTEGSGLNEALALRGLGLTWMDAGDFAKAAPALRRSLALFEGETSPQPRQLAGVYSCLGRYYSDQGKLSLGEQAYLHALALQRELAGENHPQTAIVMEALSGVYALQRRFGEAHDLASRAVRVMTASFGEKSIPAAGALATLARVEQLENHMESAAADYAAALATMRVLGATSEQHTVDVMNHYAQVLTSLRRSDEARELRKAVKAFRER